jgi:crotonobetainyl-CoA:carnitine CoA-transferase CaiB-like acyl-CoA transferase
MKKLLTLAGIAGIGAVLALLAACQTTGTSQTVVQKESLLSQSGFKVKTVTTPKQQQRVSQLPPNVVSAVKYQGKLYYVYPTAKKDQIYVGKQAQYNAYKQALKAKIISQQPQQANQTAQQQQQMLQGSPVWSGETAGPRHVQVQVFDGFGPLDPMQGD